MLCSSSLLINPLEVWIDSSVLLFLMLQMIELADIARCVATTPIDDDRSLPYLLSCLEDLKVVTERRKLDALTVETFGTRIEKLIR